MLFLRQEKAGCITGRNIRTDSSMTGQMICREEYSGFDGKMEAEVWKK